MDTNVAEICMDELAKDNVLATGEPIFCEGCNCVFNKFSKFSQEGDNQLWVCEFCGTENTINIDEEEIPTEGRLIYVLESAIESAQSRHGVDDSSSVVF